MSTEQRQQPQFGNSHVLGFVYNGKVEESLIGYCQVFCYPAQQRWPSEELLLCKLLMYLLEDGPEQFSLFVANASFAPQPWHGLISFPGG